MELERPKSRQPIPAHAKRVFKGDIFEIYQWEQELFDGSTKIFEKAKREDTIVVIPSTPDGKLIFLTDEQPGRDAILTFPAGRMDHEGESPLDAAKREFKEETGYESDEWSLWRAYHPASKVDWVVYIFVAKNSRKTAEADPGPGERITMSLKTLDEIIDLVLTDDPRLVIDNTKADFVKAKYDPAARAKLEKEFFG